MSPPQDGALETGAQIGPYEVVGLLGAGGMGEVYRARDPRIGRDVAIKVLPGSREGPEQAQRLEREARAAGALNHPNIVAVYDVGTRGDNPYVVTELLEGETLRERLRRGRLATRKAIEYGIQVAEGLAAAHDRGIWHRDIKPENLFVTRDGHLKILDFGLAKQADPDAEETDTGPVRDDVTSATSSGTVLGTVGYMSPEQVRGGNADHRSDLFSFGAVLYEMVSGERAFRRGTPAETMTAILHDHPPDLPVTDGALSVGLSHLIHRCLEKAAHDRFQSAHDLAFHLKELQGVWETTSPKRAFALPSRHRRQAVAALAVVAVATGAAGLAWLLKGTPVPRYSQVTFRRGLVHRARFAPDGRTVVYSASWSGQPSQVWFSVVGNPESRALGDPDTGVAAVSRTGELALLTRHRYAGGERYEGTLARAPWTGGVAREIVEDVQEADWGPRGELAILRSPDGAGGTVVLEYPQGRELLRTDETLHSMRVSPDGSRVAFFADPASAGFRGAVAVVDRSGKRKTVSRIWPNARGLAWSPSGREIWFTAGEEQEHRVLHAVTLDGRERVVTTAPGSLTLRDVASSGQVLLSMDMERSGLLALPPGGAREQELSWLDRSALGDLSSDGSMVLFGDRFRVYVGRTDGSRTVQLGEGVADSISHDNQRVLLTSSTLDRVSIVPIGAGSPQAVPPGPITSYSGAHWFPDDRRLLINAKEAGHGLRVYVQAVGGGPPVAISPEGSAGPAVSPGGGLVAFLGPDGHVWIVPAEGTAPPLKLAGTEPGERPIAWTADGRSLWVYRREQIPARIFKVDVLTGQRELWKTFMPEDSAGLVAIRKADVAADGRSYAYSYRRILSELYVVDGLR